jgi:energy-coupling factor transporter ATP-binding protein EcfA2
VDSLVKRYVAPGWPRRGRQLEGFRDAPQMVGLLGPNGSGKTTLFELITGSNTPSEGRVLVEARHPSRALPRARPARDPLPPELPGACIPQDQAFVPARRAGRDRPLVHLFDEPQFAIGDGTSVSCSTSRPPARERFVFLCVHPNEPFHLDILREASALRVRAEGGSASSRTRDLTADADVRGYLGRLAPPVPRSRRRVADVR